MKLQQDKGDHGGPPQFWHLMGDTGAFLAQSTRILHVCSSSERTAVCRPGCRAGRFFAEL